MQNKIMAAKGGSNRILVAAIDFGTTYSGYAFSFTHDYQKDPTKPSGKHWTAGVSTPGTSLKTSTTILLNPDKSFNSFGYEAESKYVELAMDDKHRDYYYFRRFKMSLFDKMELKRNIELEDDKGRQMPAETIIEMSIRYLKDQLLDSVTDKVLGIQESDIQWVLTVPAIWTDPAKQFMREAAVAAGIDDSQLLIALEPECASLYCRHLPVEKTVKKEAASVGTFTVGTKYLVLDVGGGTTDVTVHEVASEKTLKELYQASGGAWGGTNVDEAFKQLMCSLVGSLVFTRFSTEHTDDYLELFREFEMRKKEISPNTKGIIIFRIPLTLVEIYEEMMHKKLNETIAQSSFSDGVQLRKDKLRIDATVVKDLFKATIDNIVQHVNDILDKPTVRGTSAILMVGGFCESPMLQSAIRESCSDMKLVIPQEAGIAVLIGAVMYGHDPTVVVERRCKYTYGVALSPPFIEGVHPEHLKYTNDDVTFLCRGVFGAHTAEGTHVVVGKYNPEDEVIYVTLNENQKNMRFNIYASSNKDAKYVTDAGCIKLGKLVISIPNPGPPGKVVNVQMIYAGTELVVQGTDENGRITKGRFDFLG